MVDYSLDLFNTGIDILDFTNSDIYSKIKKITYYQEELKLKHLDLIALEYYGDLNLWWVIAMYNDIIDPFKKIDVIIKIPNYDDIDDILFDLKIKEKNE